MRAGAGLGEEDGDAKARACRGPAEGQEQEAVDACTLLEAYIAITTLAKWSEGD